MHLSSMFRKILDLYNYSGQGCDKDSQRSQYVVQ